MPASEDSERAFSCPKNVRADLSSSSFAASTLTFNGSGNVTVGGVIKGSTGTGDVASNFNSATGVSDLLVANGVTLNGATLNLADLGSTTLGLGVTFVIVDNTSATGVTGTFAGLGQGSNVTVGLNTFQISYLGGASGNDIVLTSTSAVPEPSTYALIGGVLTLGFAVWRSRKRA